MWVCLLCIGIVLVLEGGVFKKMFFFYWFGLGGLIGDG